MVEWLDSSMRGGWRSKELIGEEHISHCVSCGVLMKESKEELVLCLSLSKENYSDAMTIPRCSVIRIRYLKVGRHNGNSHQDR